MLRKKETANETAHHLGAQWSGLPAYARRQVSTALQGRHDPVFELARLLLAAVAAEHMTAGTTDEENARRLLLARAE